MASPDGKTVLVTGASGQLGRRLVPRLLTDGYSVRAHYRSNERAQKYCPPGAERVYGDLAEPSWLEEAVEGCYAVIHCAAMVSLRPRPDALMRSINVDGTRAMISACKGRDVKRLIYVSSIVTIGASENDEPIDETATFNLGGYRIPYIDMKREAERMALEANGGGLDVVVVNPSIMISAPDRPLTQRELKKIPRRVLVYFDFGLNLVETDDVVSGIISALEKGRPGERYILGGGNVFPKNAFELAGTYLNIRRPLIRMPVWTLYPIAFIIEIIARLRNKRPKFHRGLARLARRKFIYSSEKAKRELGYNPSTLRESLLRIVPLINRQLRKKNENS